MLKDSHAMRNTDIPANAYEIWREYKDKSIISSVQNVPLTFIICHYIVEMVCR